MPKDEFVAQYKHETQLRPVTTYITQYYFSIIYNLN